MCLHENALFSTSGRAARLICYLAFLHKHNSPLPAGCAARPGIIVCILVGEAARKYLVSKIYQPEP